MIMIQSSPLLRRALALDAAACAGMGALLSLAATPLSGLFALPPDLLRGAGLLLLPCAALLAWLAAHATVPRLAVLAVIGLNLLWVADRPRAPDARLVLPDEARHRFRPDTGNGRPGSHDDGNGGTEAFDGPRTGLGAGGARCNVTTVMQPS